MRISRSLLLASLVLLLPTQSAADRALFESLDGQWHRVTPDEDAARLNAIDAAVADMSWLMRTMAAPILRRSTVPPPHYVFQIVPEGLAMASRDRPLRPLQLDGVERHFETDRRSVTISAQQRDEAIETRWKTDQAEGSNTFRLADGGATLVVESVMQITAISGLQPIRYEARFARTPQVASPPSQPSQLD